MFKSDKLAATKAGVKKLNPVLINQDNPDPLLYSTTAFPRKGLGH
jgi:hypothetical protein